MEAKVVENNDYATLYYHPDTNIVHHEFHKFIYGDVFRAFMMKGTETLKEHGAKKWLSDDRKHPIFKTEDMEWGTSTWFPATLAAGWKYWAIVQPEGIVAKLELENLVKEYAKAGLMAKIFVNPEEAMKWLESQP
jgi:hypothetical protein